MSFSTWHDYGYGVCTSNLKVNSVERIEKLLEFAPEYRNDIHGWFEESGIDKPTVDDYLHFDQDYNNGIASILKEVIRESEGIEFETCDDFDCMRYLIYMPSYPWRMTERDRTVTQESLDAILKKYISVISDTEFDIDFQEIENGG